MIFLKASLSIMSKARLKSILMHLHAPLTKQMTFKLACRLYLVYLKRPDNAVLFVRGLPKATPHINPFVSAFD